MIQVRETPYFDHRPPAPAALSAEMVDAAQTALGFELPAAYLDLLLRERNGGPLRRVTYQADDRFRFSSLDVDTLFGVGGEHDLVAQQWRKNAWGAEAGELPMDVANLVLLAGTGHDAFVLDYSQRTSEPRLTHLYVDGPIEVSDLGTFADFMTALVAHGHAQPTWLMQAQSSLEDVLAALTAAGWVVDGDQGDAAAEHVVLTHDDFDAVDVAHNVFGGVASFPEYGDEIDWVVRLNFIEGEGADTALDAALSGLGIRAAN